MSVIRQGEIRGYQSGRVVVLSSDVTNEDAYPIVAPIFGRQEDLPPYLIGTAEEDPVKGAIDVARLVYANPDRLGESIGMLTGKSLGRVLDAVERLFSRG